MGLKYRVTADENHMGFTFNDAYWKFSSFGFGELGDEYVLMATLSAYPSREASQKTEASANVGVISAFGASSRPYYEAEIYSWNFSFPVETIYPSGVPVSLDEAKTIAYNFIKEYLSEIPFVDVLEEGQSSEIAN